MDHPISSCRIVLTRVAHGVLHARLLGAAKLSGSLHFLIDGKLHQKMCLAVGRKSASVERFAFPLPDHAMRGQQHRLAVSFHVQAISDADVWQCVARDAIDFRLGACWGKVEYREGAYSGAVEFVRRPDVPLELRVIDGSGNCCKLLPLLALPVNDAAGEAAFVAKFRLEREGLLPPLRFFCCATELLGSPLAPPERLIGVLETFSGQYLDGWALDLECPGAPLELVLKVDGVPLYRFRPSLRYPRLAEQLNLDEARLGTVGFRLALPAVLFDGDSHRVAVEFFGKAVSLRGSGQLVRIPPAWEPYQPKRGRPPAVLRAPVRLARPLVSVIILNRDGEHLLAALFESWQQHNTLTQVEFIVVDHASRDGSLALLEVWRRRLCLKVIALEENDSFSASCNRAAGLARGRYLLFMNNDIVWLQDALPAMLQSLVGDPTCKAVGLRLLKSTDDGSHLAQPEVQHLGISFRQYGPGYWPYESTPDDDLPEYTPRIVPAVTAAVMLCRRQEFNRLGGFSAEYFYGYEDVEFCLRLRRRLKGRIVCRNDLVALHRHGYTRLSGRAGDVFKRVWDNADTLQKDCGSWLKRAYWRSLTAGDQELTVEPLTIGLVVDELSDGAPSPYRARIERLARRLTKHYPRARVVLLRPGLGWYSARHLHLLVVGRPDYDLDALQEKRADLLVIAYCNGRREPWLASHLLARIDACLAETAALQQALATSLTMPVRLSTVDDPLGGFLNQGEPPIRIALNADEQASLPLLSLAQGLLAAGAVVWQEALAQDESPDRLADIRIFIAGDNSAGFPKLRYGTLNIAWLPERSTQEVPAGWVSTTSMPSLSWLRNLLDKILGNTFHPS